ncbi:MAG: aspartate kinase [Planctomycetota bacterium]|nr:aspartate kinase [Planctomycetota bacterium]
MSIKVCKFGGSSVADADQLRKVKAIVDADPTRRFVVPSAPGKRNADDTKVTDLLYLCHRLAMSGQPLGHVWETIEQRFQGLVTDLGLSIDMQPALDEVRAEIEGGAGAAYAASRGEALNGLVVAALLDAEYVDAAEVIRIARNARLDDSSYELLAKRCTGSGRYVIPGFYGAGPEGEVLTFSRGGSDITGSIVARAIGASVYENWTDVSGVLMTDPRIVAEAKPIREITYRELRELSYMGASVLHEDAVFPVRDPGIPINIRNTNDLDDPGTMIVTDRDPGDQVVVGIAGSSGFTEFMIEKALMNAEVGFGRRVLDVFERLGIPYEHTPSSIDTMAVVVSDRHLGKRAEQVVEDLYAAVKPDVVTCNPNLALIATVGKGMNHRIGTAARLFSALSTSQVNIRMIDQGSSEQNIIVGVEGDDLAKAIRAIYDEFKS